jgi:Ni/Co efflux regulator RcnB
MKTLVATILATAVLAAPVLADTIPTAAAVVPVSHKTHVKAVKRRAPHARHHARKAATATRTDTKPGNQ